MKANRNLVPILLALAGGLAMPIGFIASDLAFARRHPIPVFDPPSIPGWVRHREVVGGQERRSVHPASALGLSSCPICTRSPVEEGRARR